MESVHLIARGPTPVFVAMSARPEIEDDQHVQPDGRFTLTGLGGDEASVLIEQLPESGRLTREMRAALGGAVRRSAAVSRRAGPRRGRWPRWTWLEPSDDTLGGHYGRGSTASVATPKRVAQAASIIGRTFDRPG